MPARIDVETVPVSKTTDGGKGNDSIIVDLDNENDSILYDGADSPISDPVVSNGSLYKGPEKQTSGITWSIASAEGVTLQNSGVATANTYARSSYPTAAWITSGGVVTVNGLTSSQAKIVVRATYDSKTYDKTLTIKKLRGVDKYDLVISPAALTYNSSTALTNGVSKATVEVRIWRTAQNGTRTLIDDFNGANKYGLSLEVTPNITEYSSQTYGASFLVGSAIASANNTIAIITVSGIAREISEKFHLDPRRVASLLDTFSCIMQGLIPYGAQLLMAATLAQCNPINIIPHLYYTFALFAAMLLAITFRFPRK